MKASGGNLRIRLMQSMYLLLLAVVATSDGRLLHGAGALLAQSAGFLLVVAAVLGRLWTTLFIAGRKDRQLAQDGPFSVCRHPLYFFSIVAALGIGLTTLSLTLTIALPVIFGVIVVATARREDAMLHASHGAAWREYRDRVPAFWPAWSQARTLESVTVPLRIYRKAFFDAASFLGLWLLVLVIENLRAGGAWPAPFSLP